jgi:exodeoxyribonuclease VII large subunit
MLEALPVKKLIEAIKFELEANYQDVVVEGEISNLSNSVAGHWYFTLSDDVASLSAALFKMDAFRNPQIKQFKDGDKVLCIGSISVYAKKGTFQLIVKRIMHQGKGNLQEQFEFLKKKLMNEGLFDLERKKKLPPYPKKIAIITAPQGAALQDFKEVLFRRTNSIEVVLIPSLVQGEDAPKSLINALDKAYDLKGVDCIVLARGGGSMEDLWAFNNELLVRKIFQSKIPVISAVGHQVDFTLSDFVADLRVETPSAAAEVVSENYSKIKLKFQNLEKSFLYAMEQAFKGWEKRFQRINPNQVIKIILQQFHSIEKRMARMNFYDRHHEILRLHEKHLQLDELFNRLDLSLKNKLVDASEKIEKQNNLLTAMNPEKVLSRGYAFVTNKTGHVLNSKKEALKGDEIVKLNFVDGSLSAKIFDN